MRVQYVKADAFTGAKSFGNPAACIYLKEEESLSHDQMLQIAKEHSGFISEMAFCKPSGTQDADYNIRYYSSECEVEFCGHGTIACMYWLIKNTPSLREKAEARIETSKGILSVYNELAAQDAVYISAPAPVFGKSTFSHRDIAKELGIPKEQISSQYPIEAVNAGLNTLIVPIASLAAEIAMLPDQFALETFVRKNGLDTVLVYSMETEESHLIHSRVFAPKFGYLEDPATGSGNSALAYYMLKYGIWDGSNAVIEQGASPGEYNLIHIQTIKQEGTQRVLFGGKATARIEGDYII